MNHMIIPPYEPKQSEPVRPPMIYVKQAAQWEYKQIIRNLEQENPLNEEELNTLGADGWEMSGVAQQPPLAYFYFKRFIEK
ncbi:MAG TPA: hypothetical protein VK249_29010 [Anaerolineales bacterium]|nr:hypothetical protein [Anaerolineales bacterium]